MINHFIKDYFIKPFVTGKLIKNNIK
jgi:hypothetical protein